jgi:hypothetical protein
MQEQTYARMRRHLAMLEIGQTAELSKRVLHDTAGEAANKHDFISTMDAATYERLTEEPDAVGINLPADSYEDAMDAAAVAAIGFSREVRRAITRYNDETPAAGRHEHPTNTSGLHNLMDDMYIGPSRRKFDFDVITKVAGPERSPQGDLYRCQVIVRVTRRS